MGGFALLLRWLTWWQAVALAAGALAFNLLRAAVASPAQLYRPAIGARRLHGILFYPLAVLMLLLCFPRRPDIVAGAWGILAIGDGLATLVGRAVGGRRWPWNRDKTVGRIAGVRGWRRGGRRVSRLVVPLPNAAPEPAVLSRRRRRRGRAGRGARRDHPGPPRRQSLRRRRRRRHAVARIAAR